MLSVEHLLRQVPPVIDEPRRELVLNVIVKHHRRPITRYDIYGLSADGLGA